MSSENWPMCDECGDPAVCLGADLVAPKWRCGGCCWKHDGNAAIRAHRAAEGIPRPIRQNAI